MGRVDDRRPRGRVRRWTGADQHGGDGDGALRGELATIRLLGGTSGHVLRMVVLEMATTVAVAVTAAGAIVRIATAGVPRGVTGVPIDAPAALLAMLVAGAAALGLAATAVAARLALRASPIEAMRVA